MRDITSLRFALVKTSDMRHGFHELSRMKACNHRRQRLLKFVPIGAIRVFTLPPYRNPWRCAPRPRGTGFVHQRTSGALLACQPEDEGSAGLRILSRSPRLGEDVRHPRWLRPVAYVRNRLNSLGITVASSSPEAAYKSHVRSNCSMISERRRAEPLPLPLAPRF